MNDATGIFNFYFQKYNKTMKYECLVIGTGVAALILDAETYDFLVLCILCKLKNLAKMADFTQNVS